MAGSERYLRPEVLARIARLELRARLVVEGFVSGRHRSPFHGFSVEYAGHREYVPGDDIRYVDWKIFARADRFYVKQFEEETDLRAWLLVDGSESMRYRSGAMSKYDYAATIAASLAFLLLGQRDAVGLAIFNDQLRRFVPARSHPAHLRVLAESLSEAPPAGKTDFSALCRQLAERIRRKGMIIVFSDLLAPVPAVLEGLRRFRHARHEVIVFQVLDDDEENFPFRGPTLFQGLEAAGDVFADPEPLRLAYREALATVRRELRAGLAASRIDFVPLLTGQPLDTALAAYLARRGDVRLV